MLADARLTLAQVMQRCLKAPETLTVDRWCDRYRILPDFSPRPGPWRTVTVQYARQPMRDFTDPAVNDIVLQWGTQIGKSSIFENCLLWAVANDPGPAMYIMDSQDQAENLMKDRIRPSLECSPELKQHIPSDRSDKAIKRYRFDTMALYISGAGSAGQLSAKSIKYMFKDEIDKWPQVLGGRGGTEDAAINVANTRTDAFGDLAKRLTASSPTEEGIGIDIEMRKCDRATWHMPCPHCLRYQVLRFSIGGRGGLRWEGGSGARLNDSELKHLVERVQRTAYYECEHCQGKIENQHKSLMIARGVWVFEGQEVRVVNESALSSFDPFDALDPYEDLVPPGVELVGSAPTGRRRGYQLGQLSSAFVSFGAIAGAFVEERGEVNRTFVNTKLAEVWETAGSRLKEGAILSLARETPEGEESYARGTAPQIIRVGAERRPGVLALLGTIDVQKSMAYWLVRGWGEARQSWLIDWGTVEWPEAIDEDTGEVLQPPDPQTASIQELERWARITEDAATYVVELTRRRFPLSVPATRDLAPSPGLAAVQFWGIDTGHRTAETYALVERVGDAMVAMKGMENIKFPVRRAVVGDQASTEKGSVAQRLAAGTGIELLEFQNLFWKDDLWRSIWSRPPMHGCYRWPLDMDGEYARQMEAEQRVTHKIGRSTNFRVAWEKRKGRHDNHFWDCEVMQRVLAVDRGVDELSAQPTPTAPSLPVRAGIPVR